MHKKGKLIVIEGMDFSGKTLQSTLLKGYFYKHKVIVTNEPGSKWSNITKKIREIIKEDVYPLTNLFLYSADRIEHVNKVIIPKLNSGYYVISDRFFYSTLVYQCDSMFNQELFEQIVMLATNGVKPDITFILDGDPEVLIKRNINRIGDKNAIEKWDNKSIEFHKKIRERYLQLADKYDNIYVINVERDSLLVQQEIRNIINEKNLINS